MRVMRRLATPVLFLFALSFTVFAIQSGDVFMYLAIARDFLLKNDWSMRDPYLYALPGAQLVWVHEYLSHLAFAGAHALGGLAGLVVLKAVLLAMLFALVLRAAPRSVNASPLWIALWTLAVLSASFRFIERSSLFSDLFCVWLVGELLEAHHVTRRLLVRLSVLFVLWIQFHPGFPLGFALLGLWAAWNLVYNPQVRARDAALLLLPVAATVLNPRGLAGVWYPFAFGLDEARTLRHFNFEWFPAYHPAFRFAPETCAFWVLAAAVAIVVTRERAWSSLRAWMATLAFAFAVSAVRFIPWAAFAMVIAVKPWAQLRALRVRPALLAGILALLTALAGLNFISGYRSSSGPRHPGFGLDPAFFPRETLAFLRDKPIAGRIYNTHDFGAWMIWNGLTPVFHHGFVTDMKFYYEDVVGIFESPERFFELARKHDWTMLLVEKRNSWTFFHRALSPHPEWRIVAEDQAAYLIYRLP